MSDTVDIPDKTDSELTQTYNGRPSVGAKLAGAAAPKDELELSRSPPSGKEGQHQSELKRMKAEAAQ